MLPVFSPPSWITSTRLLDVSTVTALFVVAAALIFPAIGNSRLHAHVATCQDGLRQFGVVIADRSRLHGAALSESAAGERNNAVDRMASSLTPAEFLLRLPEALPADAAVVVQNTLGTRSSRAAALRQGISGPGVLQTVAWSAMPEADQRAAARRVVYLSSPMLPESPSTAGAWTDDGASVSCASLPDSADAMAALSNWGIDEGGGQGWNALFEDGHVDFLSHASPHELARLFFEDAPVLIGGLFDSGSSNP